MSEQRAQYYFSVIQKVALQIGEAPVYISEGQLFVHPVLVTEMGKPENEGMEMWLNGARR